MNDLEFCQGGDDEPQTREICRQQLDHVVRYDCDTAFYKWQGLWWVWDALPSEGKRWHRWCRETAEAKV